ncbi:hypothetical protein [Paenibacillus wenxiniae]|uniref:Uncharacterized protein n=1 Tax=Paenibacillus wenxiniae TaxID=1636843 RepID=A0ABW4RNF3_9BACL
MISRLRQGPDKLFPQLIHPSEVNLDVSADELLLQLIVLGKTRGLSTAKNDMELVQIFKKNLQVQAAFESEDFQILPLPDPDGISCYYFRNRNGLFYGNLEPYLTTVQDQLAVDGTVYWEQWQRSLPHFQLFDIEASNHITLLFEAGVSETIGKFCEQLYQ